MKLKIFSIFDTKAEAFNTPFFFSFPGQATRAFEDLVNDPQSQISKHPEDYSLFELGEFDSTTGVIEKLDTPTNISLGIQHKEK